MVRLHADDSRVAPRAAVPVPSSANRTRGVRPRHGAHLGHPLLVNAAPVASIAFDPSGTRSATTGGPEGGHKLWFTSSLQQDGATLDPEPDSFATARSPTDALRGAKLQAANAAGASDSEKQACTSEARI
jgi:hypothetical protein